MSWLPAVLKVRFVRWALAALTICMLCPAETTIRQRHPVRSIKTATALCWAKDPVFWFLKTMNMPRNAAPKIYAEIVGYGLSADAHHITTPSAEGPMRCMKNAMRQAGLNPSDIQYLNAHGTSTSVGDVNETNAIKLAFGEDAKKLVVNSTKSMTGHLLGGAGGIESVFTVLALKNQVSPPTINIFNQDPECDLDYCANVAREMPIRYAMKNSFGFGGTNGSLIFGQV